MAGVERSPGEVFVLAPGIEVHVTNIRSHAVSLSFDVDPDVPVVREELTQESSG